MKIRINPYNLSVLIRSAAFTLIEILIAMAILIIIVTSTLAIFRASATSWRKGEMRAQRYQQARFILDRMSREMSSIVPASLAGPYCLGMADKFYFICSLADATTLIEAGYWFNEEAQELMRNYQGAPDYDFSTFEKEEILSENVSALQFEYYTGEQWQQNWDSRPQAAQEGLLPRAIKISFDIQEENSAKTESFSTIVTLPASK